MSYEFKDSGVVKLAEIDFKTMASKVGHCLYFAGEIIDVDGVTGGFDFQNAWIVGQALAKSLDTPES